MDVCTRAPTRVPAWKSQVARGNALGGRTAITSRPLPVGREISRMTVVFVRLERLVSILAVRPIAPLSFPFRSSESGNAVSRRMSPLTILTNCKNAHVTDNGQKSRFILEEMFCTVIENYSRYLVLLLYEISFS